MKKSTTVLAFCFCALLTGCVHHHRSHPHGMPPGQAKKILHHHGDACGHVFFEGHWVLVESVPGHCKHKGKAKGWKHKGRK